MLISLLEQERAVSAVLAESTKASDCDLILSSDQLTKLKGIAKVLKPCVAAT